MSQGRVGGLQMPPAPNTTFPSRTITVGLVSHCGRMSSDIWFEIYKKLDLHDRKQCRLVDKYLGGQATPLVFETVHFSFTEPSILKFESIGTRQELAYNVKTIILQLSTKREYPAFPSQESWERNVWCREDDHDMTSDKWENMTSVEKKA